MNILDKKLVICIKNDDYLASLEIKKIYEIIPDEKAKKHNLIRVVDESGEDYLYPNSYFLPLELTNSSQELLALFH
ncbi:MAG: hypothetical protein GW856_12690 [Cyanobacteria bacterium]|nr:hypothetical protein [Cyanobacteria bacterium CG_2015-16_32_12]NCO79495.1 hypothetical protein [Cyanobacteria bacterium CG_2015-22_32_23]NCS85471.1 hypothetical protein [Cyanobacteria bacterium CG_2015-02_32_10]